jgi:hypothetical protein
MKSRHREKTSSNNQNLLYHAIMTLLRLHSGVLLSQQRTFPLPLGKTRFLAAVTVDTCGAWAVCLRDAHGHVLFPYRFHDALAEHA